MKFDENGRFFRHVKDDWGMTYVGTLCFQLITETQYVIGWSTVHEGELFSKALGRKIAGNRAQSYCDKKFQATSSFERIGRLHNERMFAVISEIALRLLEMGFQPHNSFLVPEVLFTPLDDITLAKEIIGEKLRGPDGRLYEVERTTFYLEEKALFDFRLVGKNTHEGNFSLLSATEVLRLFRWLGDNIIGTEK